MVNARRSLQPTATIDRRRSTVSVGATAATLRHVGAKFGEV